MKSELLSLLDELPEIYKGVAAAISGLKNVTHYYETFVNFLVPRYVNSVCCHHYFCNIKVVDSRLTKIIWNQLSLGFREL